MNTLSPAHPKRALSLLAICLLAACGGGGGGSPSTAPTPTPQTHTTPAPQNPAAEQPQHNAPTQPEPTPPTHQPEEPAAPDVQPDAAPKPPSAETDTPAQPAPDVSAEVPKLSADEQTFQYLSLDSLSTKDGIQGHSLMKLVLEDQGRTVEVALLDNQNSFFKKDIQTLRDSKGNLVGYYGFAAVHQPLKNGYGEYDGSSQHYFFLQSADETKLKRPDSFGDIQYRGNMLYHYTDHPTDLMKADVQATYHGKDNTLSMMMHDDRGGEWSLHQERHYKSSPRVAVDERGTVGGHLFYAGQQGGNPIFNGTFSGGFYGENGSVLTGKAEHSGSNAWQGVVGAVAR